MMRSAAPRRLDTDTLGSAGGDSQERNRSAARGRPSAEEFRVTVLSQSFGLSSSADKAELFKRGHRGHEVAFGGRRDITFAVLRAVSIARKDRSELAGGRGIDVGARRVTALVRP
jgi:hypothetical protein